MGVWERSVSTCVSSEFVCWVGSGQYVFKVDVASQASEVQGGVCGLRSRWIKTNGLPRGHAGGDLVDPVPILVQTQR